MCNWAAVAQAHCAWCGTLGTPMHTGTHPPGSTQDNELSDREASEKPKLLKFEDRVWARCSRMQLNQGIPGCRRAVCSQACDMV
jgi:hypothetical protein